MSNEKSIKSGFISILGRPNAGKSSLMNWLVGEKLAIVSQKANATRRRFSAIVTYEKTQMIFIDTPGIHEKERLLNKYMLQEALASFSEADLLVYMAPVHDTTAHYEHFLELNKYDVPHILLLSKIDEVSKDELLLKIKEYDKFKDNYKELIPISIKKGGGSQDIILKFFSNYIPTHPFFYEDDLLTTEFSKDIYKEFIREAIFDFTSDEIPYSCDVIVSKVLREPKIIKIYATIVVEQKSQKGMVIGKAGNSIRRIGQRSRELIEKLEEMKVFLKLEVRVEKNWSKNIDSMKALGYKYSE